MRSSRIALAALAWLWAALFASGACASWPMFQRYTTHPGWTYQDGAESSYAEWTFAITPPSGWGNSPLVWSSPVIDKEKVYVGTRHGYIYCFDFFDGDSLWAVQVADAISATPAIAEGRLYVLGGATDRKLHCIDASNGDSLWATELGADSTWNCGLGGREIWMESSATVIGDSVVFVGSRDGKAYCVDAQTGSIRWSTTLTIDGYVVSSPAYWDGRLYIGATGTPFGAPDSSCVFCLDAEDGDVHWRHAYYYGNAGGTMSSPTVDVSRERIYIGINKNHGGVPPEHNGGAIACYRWAYDGDTQGPPYGLPVAPEWTVGIDCDVRGTPLLLDDLVYASTGKGLWILEAANGNVLASDVKPGGNEELWSSITASCRNTAAEQETILYVGNGGFGDGEGFYALDPSLTTLWSVDTDCEVWGSAAISSGRVVMASNSGTVYCFMDDPNSEGMTGPAATALGLASHNRGSPGPIQSGAGSLLRALDGARSWPEPSRGEVRLSFDLPGTDLLPVELTVMDAAGRVVRTLLASAPCRGRQLVTWDGRTDGGLSAPAGVYFYRLQAGGHEVSRAMTLLR